MGSCLSSADHATESLPATEKQASATQPEEAMGDDIGDFVLKKRRPGCTGMFWRSDPTGQEQLMGGQNWPQDGATLRGVTVEHEDEKFLKCLRVKQEGGKWLDTPAGAYIPFEYDDHYYLDPAK